MYRVFIISIFVLAGCSNITFNATMCDEIRSDPQATVPQECRVYNEDEATKAFNKTQNKSGIQEEIELLQETKIK